jgi:hypothetical protein
MEAWADEQLAGEPANMDETFELQQQKQAAIPALPSTLASESHPPAAMAEFHFEAVRFCSAADCFITACDEGLNLLLQSRKVVGLPAASGSVAEGSISAIGLQDGSDGLLTLLKESLAGLEQRAASARLYTLCEAE